MTDYSTPDAFMAIFGYERVTDVSSLTMADTDARCGPLKGMDDDELWCAHMEARMEDLEYADWLYR